PPGTPARPGGNQPRPPPRGEPGPDHVHMPGMPFEFEYAVNDVETANDYAHKANSDGDVVTGEYRVQLPDGRTQVVRYTADWKTGYHADVSYEGEPQYPQGPGGRPGYKY
ncbi:pro-resilin-like, partial [Musca vetustissima]|uniref:pro-resilin-like n=2 Tax=Musca vetustissima TaxID=27455 RepID=UPI002AB78291